MGRQVTVRVAFRFLVVACVVSLVAGAMAQDGGSTAGLARSRALGKLGMMPSSREVAVEEFVNYHRHEIGRPKGSQAVGLDVRWSKDPSGAKDSLILQVGLSTALATDRAQLRPVNLALVIDKSGSMAAANKLSRVKQALLKMVDGLRPTDTISIVTFDSAAQVLFPVQVVGDKEALRTKIRTIEPGSSTNINAGLMLGFEEAAKKLKKDGTNRVVLLTDGIANVGVTDAAKIAKASLDFNEQGIDLSTIGVGQSLNEDLLRSLAKSGRGLYHFVADDGDIEKVFVKEVQSLLSPVAKNPTVTVEIPSDLALAEVYGYEPKIEERSVEVAFDNLNSGATQVVLMRFRKVRREAAPLHVKLTYQDLLRSRAVTTDYMNVERDLARDLSVDKNQTIALLASAMKKMAGFFEEGQRSEAANALDRAIKETRRRYPSVEDEDIKRTLLIAEKYREALVPEG